MKLSLAPIAWRNLTNRPVRTTFTVLGIALGITAIVSISGLSMGLNKTWEKSASVRGIDIVVSKGGGSPMTSLIDDSVEKKLMRIPQVKSTSATLLQMLSVEEAPMMIVSGRQLSGFGWEHLEIQHGRLPANADEKAVVLGTDAADSLNKKIGDMILIELEEFEVVGIADGGAMIENNSILLSLAWLQKTTGNEGRINFVNIRLQDASDEAVVEAVCQDITSRFPKLQANPSGKTLSSTRSFKVAQMGSLATSMLALAMGALGVMNTMLMSVFERKREIGILSAIGWRRSRIISLILLESMLLSALGCIIGLILGVVTLKGIGTSVQFKGVMEPYMGPDLLLAAFGISIIVGLLSGVYPAWKGSGITPAEALRSQ